MNITVIGAGNWGATLAGLFATNNAVTLWTANQQDAQNLQKNRTLPQFPAGYALPQQVKVAQKFTTPLSNDDIVVLALPSSQGGIVAGELAQQGYTGIVLNVSKGLAGESIITVGQEIRNILPNARHASLSGPNIATEIAAGIPAKTVLASRDLELLYMLSVHLQNPVLSFEYSRDVAGVELCAALKGVIAVAVGLAQGLGFSTNMYGLIMTYGLAEFAKVAQFLGVRHDTVYSIAGMGDLITTCLSQDSRNRRFGNMLAQGLPLDEALGKVGMVVEGVSVARTVYKLAQFNIDVPLIGAVAKIIFDPVDDRRELLLQTINGISHR